MKNISHKTTLMVVALIALWCGAAWLIAQQQYLAGSRSLVEEQTLKSTEQAVDLTDSIERNLHYLRGIPDLLSHLIRVNAAVSKVGAGSNTPSALPYEVRKARWTADPMLNDLDQYLALAAASLNVDLIYVVNAAGDSIASSNWDTAGTSVGTNFAERVFFQANQKGLRGHQYAVGKSTNIPGLYFSSPVISKGKFAGAVVVKVDVPKLSYLTRQNDAYIADANGVIILAHHREYEMHALPGSAVTRMSDTERMARYRRTDIPLFPISPWGDPQFPGLLQMQGEDNPLVRVSKDLDEYGLRVFIEGDMENFTALARERLWSFTALSIIGSLIILALAGIVLYLRSVREARERLRASEARFSLRLANLGEGVFETDDQGRCSYANPAAMMMLGFSEVELMGQDQHALFHYSKPDGSAYAVAECPLYQTLHDGQLRHLEEWFWRKDGSGFPVTMTVSAIRQDGAVHGSVVVFQDITERKHAEASILSHANYDQLTQLPNRRLFQERMQQAIKKSKRDDLSVALLLIDLDHFKEVNDTLGHGVGDALLVEATQRIAACVRDTDTVARLGGDEFSVILPELAETACIERIAQSIIKQLSTPFLLGEERAYISGSVGIALYPNDARDIEALLKHADQAMYAAKSAGRNRFSYYTASLQEAAQKRMRMTNDLRSAVEQDQLRVLYQPIVEIKSGKISKAEALVRWQHPSLGLVSPVEFIPLAEESGLIVAIGDWVFKQALQQCKFWRASYDSSFEVSVNKSPVQFKSDGGDADDWLAYLQEQEMPGTSLVIEITEGLLLDVDESVRNKLLGFRDAGVQVAIDDFGTGYSSLSYLRELDIDYLKIDRAFINGLDSDKDQMALCDAIIVMAHKLGLKVVAEGVETQSQHDMLSAAGCDYAQGYFYSRPVPAEQLEQMLALAGGKS